MDISDIVRAQRWCRYASWPTYLAAALCGLVSVLALIPPPSSQAFWFAMSALALALLGYSVQRGSRLGALVQAFVVVGFEAYVDPRLRGLRTWDVSPHLALGTVIALSGVIATFASSRWKRKLGALPCPGFGRWLRHRTTTIRSTHIWMAAVHVCVMCVLLLAVVVASFTLGHAVSSGRWTWFGSLSGLIVLLLSIVLSGTGMAYAWRTAKRHAALQAEELRRRDTRPPVLLLRSFGDDVMGLDRRPTLNTPLSFYDAKALTLEEVIERALWPAGPVIAIGRPGERLPPAGAAREYAPDEEWQARVKALIAECQYISVIAGITAGLIWECQAVSEARALAKVIVILPPHHEQVESAWRTISAALSLPESAVPPRALVARLHDTGTPSFITCRWSDEEAYRLAIEYSLQPAP